MNQIEKLTYTARLAASGDLWPHTRQAVIDTAWPWLTTFPDMEIRRIDLNIAPGHCVITIYSRRGTTTWPEFTQDELLSLGEPFKLFVTATDLLVSTEARINLPEFSITCHESYTAKLEQDQLYLLGAIGKLVTEVETRTYLQCSSV